MLRLFFVILVLAFTSGCAVNLKSLISQESELKNRRDFNSYLALEYLEYSRSLANKYSWNDADFFAKKGLLAANYKPVFPEVPESWGLDASQIEEATLARQKLVKFLNSKEVKVLPIQIAHLNFLYDCWISQEKITWRLPEMFKCKARFFKLTKEIEDYFDKQQVKQIVRQEEIEPPYFKKFSIYFDFDSYKINQQEQRNLLGVFTYLAALNGDYRIILVGAADRAGKKLYNQSIARKRVMVIRDYLIKNGVPEELIESKSFGEEIPDLVTKDNKQNKENRRVGVYILQGSEFMAPIPLPLIENYIYKQEIIKEKKDRGLN